MKEISSETVAVVSSTLWSKEKKKLKIGGSDTRTCKYLVWDLILQFVCLFFPPGCSSVIICRTSSHEAGFKGQRL